MKNLLTVLAVLFCFLFSSQTPSPYIDQFDSFGGVGEWSIVTGQGNTGSHSGFLCYNLTGNYLAGEYYSFESPTLDLSGWVANTLDLDFSMEKSLRSGDNLYLFYYDNGWFYFNLTSLADGAYTAPIPKTATLLSFDLDVAGSGTLNNKYVHIDFIRLSDPDAGALPVELVMFEGRTEDNTNIIEWATESEHNSEKFELQKSTDTEDWRIINTTPAAGYSVEYIQYTTIDYSILPVMNYYRLLQYDIDGEVDTYGPIAINNLIPKSNLLYYINLEGKKIDPSTAKGILIEVYEDGSIRKIFQP